MRRMINTKIADRDTFLDMPPTARLLYYDLLIRADDDGFITPNYVVRMTGASPDDLKILVAKQFVHQWQDGVIVLLHWREHNHVKSDRYEASEYSPRLRQIAKLYALGAREDGSKMVPKRIQTGSKMVPQGRVGKGRVGEVRITSNTSLETEEIQEMREAWKAGTGTTLRNHVEENLRDYRYLLKELGSDLALYLGAVRMIRADRYQRRALQDSLFSYAGLRKNLEQVEAYMQGKVDGNQVASQVISAR